MGRVGRLVVVLGSPHWEIHKAMAGTGEGPREGATTTNPAGEGM